MAISTWGQFRWYDMLSTDCLCFTLRPYINAFWCWVFLLLFGLGFFFSVQWVLHNSVWLFFFTLTKYLLKRERHHFGAGKKLIAAPLDTVLGFPRRCLRKKPPKRRVEHRCLWNGELQAPLRIPGNSRGAFPGAAAPSPGAREERGAPGRDPAALRGNPRESPTSVESGG